MDIFSYRCGVMDAFCEVVRAGVKRIALAHPCDTKDERDSYIRYANYLCSTYRNHLYIEDDAFITDLFPASLNRGKYNIIFYRDQKDIDKYLELKSRKKDLVIEHRYSGEERYKIALEFGELLSYSKEAIDDMIQLNEEKEDIE